jgi:hypothetical protein
MPAYVPWNYISRLPAQHRIDKQLPPEQSPLAFRRMRGFETEEAAWKEDRKRARLLSDSTRLGPGWLSNAGKRFKHQVRNGIYGGGAPTPRPQEMVALRADLEKALKIGRHPQTLASFSTYRLARIAWIGALAERFECTPADGLRTFTLMHPDWVIAAVDLLNTPASYFTARFRADLRTIKIAAIPGPLIAWIHCEYEPFRKVFIFHFHGVTTAAKAQLLRKLTKATALGYRKTSTGGSALRIVKVSDRFRQFSYLVKGFWPQRAVREVAPGVFKRDRKIQRIHEPYGSMALLWLYKHGPTDIAVLQGCRFMPDGQLRAAERLVLTKPIKAVETQQIRGKGVQHCDGAAPANKRRIVRTNRTNHKALRQ